MQPWFVVTTIVIFIAGSVIIRWQANKAVARQIARLDEWEHWSDTERFEVLRTEKVTTFKQVARIWEGVALLVLMTLWFVPNALLQSGTAAGDAEEAAERSEEVATDAEDIATDVAVQADRIESGINNSEYESCVNSNENRLYNRYQKQVALDQAEMNLANAVAAPAIDITALPGFSALTPTEQQIWNDIEALVAASRDENIRQLESEVERISTDLATYEEQFPLRSCGGDPIPTTSTTTSTTTTTTTSTTTTSTSTTSTTLPPTSTAAAGGPPATFPFPATTVRPPTVGPTAPATTVPATTTTVPVTTTTLDCPGNSNNCNRERGRRDR